jgi:hypothetical protein
MPSHLMFTLHIYLALEKGNVLACQFHPELSGKWGSDIWRRWLGIPVHESDTVVVAETVAQVARSADGATTTMKTEAHVVVADESGTTVHTPVSKTFRIGMRQTTIA